MDFDITESANGLKTFTTHTPFHFENGKSIAPLVLAFETYGTCNADQSNVILIHHALSTNSHLCSHDKNPDPGWWENMVGPGKPIDTDHYHVICVNNLGSCFGSSGPTSLDPSTGRAYQAHFPAISIVDMAMSQKLLIDALGITQLHAVLGNSMGGMISLVWAMLFPDTVRHAVLVSSSYKSYPANQANRAIQRDIIQMDPLWNKGFYTEPPTKGFTLARKHGILTYRNWAELNRRFKDKTADESIQNYLEYNAEKFVSKFDVNSYLYLLNAMDAFDMTRGHENKRDAFQKITAKCLVVTVNSDVLYTPDQQLELFDALREAKVDVQLVEHVSEYGHDAFLIETAAFGRYISDFIR